MCGCLRDLCAREQIAQLSSLLGLGDQSFDSFSLDYYSTQPQPGHGDLSPGKHELSMRSVSIMPKSLGNLLQQSVFERRDRSGQDLFVRLHRPGGGGKWTLVVYDTAGNIFAQFEAQKFSRDQEDCREARDETRRYLNCDLLIMDDLGSEMTTPFVQSALYQLDNSRLTAVWGR